MTFSTAQFGDHHTRLAGKIEAASERRAHGDAMRAIARDIPDPRDYAYQLGAEYVAMLLGATLRDNWYVTEAVAKVLRPHGLCEYGGTGLTAFGIMVRRELKAMDA